MFCLWPNRLDKVNCQDKHITAFLLEVPSQSCLQCVLMISHVVVCQILHINVLQIHWSAYL
jgi:hypothetical protein